LVRDDPREIRAVEVLGLKTAATALRRIESHCFVIEVLLY